MRVGDRRALPREAACFRDGQIDVGRSAFRYVLAGPKASWEGGGGGGNTSKATCPDTKKDNNYHRHTIRVHTNVSQSAEVKPTFYRWPLDRGMHVLRHRSSELELWRYAIQLPVGLAGRPCWVKGHCCLVPACQAVAVDHLQVTTCTAPSKRQELVCWRKKVTLAACVRTARTVWTASFDARCGGFESFVWLRFVLPG